MNIHFSSFLFDVAIWMAFGVWVAYWSAAVQKDLNRIRMRIALYALLSMTIGLWTVLDVGLPSYGFAVQNFIYVAAFTFLAAFFTSPSVRSLIARDALTLYHKLQKYKLAKTGILPGRNR